MRMIAPRTGHLETTIAEDQLDYKPITVNVFRHDNGTSTIVTRWQPTEAERMAIAAGEDIYVSQVNFGAGMTPMMVDCGKPEWVPAVQGGGN